MTELCAVLRLEQKGSNMIALVELIFNIPCLPQIQTAHPPQSPLQVFD